MQNGIDNSKYACKMEKQLPDCIHGLPEADMTITTDRASCRKKAVDYPRFSKKWQAVPIYEKSS
jgi:hypothetical protein